MRRVRMVWAAVVIALSLPALPPAHAAGEAVITDTGWWSQRPGASELPTGGFELALAPNDAISIAALRVEVASVQLSFALLELTPSEEFGAEVAAVHACPTTDAWVPDNPGAWDDAPEPDCDRKEIVLSRRQTGEWSSEVSELLSLGTNSIVLVPASHPDTQGLPAPYQLVFESAKLTASAPSPPPPPSSPSGGGGAQPSGGAPRIIAAPRSPPTGAFPAAPPIVVEPSGSSIPSYELPQAAAPLTSREPGEPRPWWRLALLVPISAALAFGSVVLRRLVL